MNATAYIAASVDGFIARPNGEVDWLGEPSAEVQVEFERFMAGVDCLVMGRNTYETVLSFGQWPYTKPVVVLSSREIEVPENLAQAVRRMSGAPSDIAKRLADEGVEHAYVDRGRTIQAFLAEGLLQRILITRIPVLLGAGIPLFGPLPADVRLKLVQSRTLAGGSVQTEYAVV